VNYCVHSLWCSPNALQCWLCAVSRTFAVQFHFLWKFWYIFYACRAFQIWYCRFGGVPDWNSSRIYNDEGFDRAFNAFAHALCNHLIGFWRVKFGGHFSRWVWKLVRWFFHIYAPLAILVVAFRIISCITAFEYRIHVRWEPLSRKFQNRLWRVPAQFNSWRIYNEKIPKLGKLWSKSLITTDHIQICVCKYIQTSKPHQWPCASPVNVNVGMLASWNVIMSRCARAPIGTRPSRESRL